MFTVRNIGRKYMRYVSARAVLLADRGDETAFIAARLLEIPVAVPMLGWREAVDREAGLVMLFSLLRV